MIHGKFVDEFHVFCLKDSIYTLALLDLLIPVYMTSSSAKLVDETECSVFSLVIINFRDKLVNIFY